MTYRRFLSRLVVVAILSFGGAEVGLRAYGFGSPPLYVSSDRYEYVFRPNQDLERFGHHVLVNEASLRSRPLSADDDPVVLLVGDSVVNGGAPTDQDSLASTRLERELEADYGPTARVLNVSAGSWGPANAVAFLKEKGTFGAEVIVAVFSSHDATDGMTFTPVVGVDPSYPDHRPVSAIYEALDRYILPRVDGWLSGRSSRSSEARAPSEPVPLEPALPRLDVGWQQLVDLADSLDVPLVLYLHPELGERARGAYDPGGQAILAFAGSLGLPVIRGLSVPMDSSAYRDNIHLDEEGQRRLTGVLYGPIRRALSRRAVANMSIAREPASTP